MAIEIERKFLISNLNALQRDLDSIPKFLKIRLKKQSFAPISIKQGYLSVEPVVRIRLKDDKAFITIKGKGLKSRQEFEYEIPFIDGRKLFRMCKKKIDKTRYQFGRWEIDEFHGPRKGLWLAEYELKSKNEKIPKLPCWIGKEVTGDPKYMNVNL